MKESKTFGKIKSDFQMGRNFSPTIPQLKQKFLNFDGSKFVKLFEHMDSILGVSKKDERKAKAEKKKENAVRRERTFRWCGGVSSVVA